MLIEISAAAIGGGFVGYFTCAAMTMGKVADTSALEGRIARQEAMIGTLVGKRIKAVKEAAVAVDAHDRASDALATQRARIDRALAVETPKAAHGVKKMARILRGDA